MTEAHLCHSLMERSPVPMAELEGVGHIIHYVNRAFCRLVGKDREALLGKPFADTVQKGDRCLDIFDRVYRTGESETHTESEQVEPHPAYWTYAIWPVLDDTQTPIGLMMQVTETSLFHQQTGAMNQALMRSSVRQHELTEAAEQLNDQLRAEVTDWERMQREAVLSRQVTETLNTELRESEKRLARELAATKELQAASALLIEGGQIEAIYQKVVDAAVAIMGSDFASLQFFYPDRAEGVGELLLLAHHGFAPESAEAFKWVRTDTGCTCGETLRTGTRTITPDIESAPFIVGRPGLQAYRQSGIRAVQTTPLISRGDGRLIGMISTHWRKPHTPKEGDLRQFDILARQAADLLERRQAEQALRESEERYRTLFAAAPMAVFVCDRNAVIRQYNRHAVELWAREPNCGVEQYCGSLKLWLHDGTRLPHAQSPMADVLRTGIPARNVEMFIERPDGSRLPVLMNFAPLKNAQGDIEGAITSFMDITDRKRTEARLTQFTDELERRVYERTQELAQSEDQLRTLATELNLAEQRERKRLATDLHDYLAQLLVLCVLALGQAKRTNLPPRAEQLVKETEDNLSKSLAYCRTLMSELSPPVLQEQGLPAGLLWLGDHMKQHELAITVEIQQAFDVPLPEDRAVLLFQSVRELLINVAKHGAVKKAAVRMTYRNGLLDIVVSDENGFDLAASAAPAGDASPLSSKFGLFSIRERMKALGGSFDIESAPGQGTVATLTLPVTMRREEPEVRRESGKKTIGHLPPCISAPTDRPILKKNAQIRVLLVDDQTLMREGLRSIVSTYDHLEVVGEARDGVEAVGLAQQLDPDIVVMDINMPDMDGIEATRQIKLYRPGSVVIGLSVNPSAETEQKIKAAGAAAYLTKESAADALYHAIQEAMVHKQGPSAR